MRENWLGPCGHAITNIGTAGCAICLAQTPWAPAIIHPGGSEVEQQQNAEIVAGATRPLSREEIGGLLTRFLPHAEAAAELRQRVTKGKALIASADPAKIDVEDARARLEALEEELRREEWGELISLAISLGHGCAGLLDEASSSHAWRPPAGSLLRIKLPGILDLTVDMTQYGPVAR
jgi:hypothetical protein